ncbi:MAG: pitrilysin family protein [Thermodesulfobacteriota bacterium]|nr:pitrilysin family protein [Thermodesulfobacteriota bacterium]
MRDYQRFQLKNGMTVILKENHSAPVVALQVWVKVGSADETDDEAGMCHLIEHMLFKGTERRKAGKIAYEVESSGGEINAYTSFDQTVYHIVIASRFLDLGLDILSDAIRNPSFDLTELEREKEVILEEIKRGEDNPMVRLSQSLFSTSYRSHAYRRPIIGFEDTVKGFTRENLLDFHSKWYMPGNIVLVAVGDIDPNTTCSRIKGIFQDFHSEESAKGSRVQELSQEGIRSEVLFDNIMEGYMNVAFHVPGINHKDLYALDVLSFILGHGESSRLFRKVKDEKGLVHYISTYYFIPKEPGLFVINGTMDTIHSKEALAAILGEIYRLRYEEVTEDELEKAKLNIESEFIYASETVEGQARQLGSFEVIAENIAFAKHYTERISRVRSQDVMRVARRYLTNKNLTAVFLLPVECEDHIDQETIQEIANKESAALRRHYSNLRTMKEGKVQKRILKNGMTCLIREDHTSPIVAMRAAFLGGLRFEKKRVNGVNNFIAEMITKGTKNLDALEIAHKIESMAGSIHGFSGRNSFGLQSEILSRFFDRGLQLLADITINPTFDPVELEKKRTDILAALKQQEDNLVYHTFNAFAKTLYEKHPYGMNILGDTESILNMTRNDLKNYYKLYANPKNLVLSIVGDIRTEDIFEQVEELFKDFTENDFKIPRIPKESPSQTVKNVEIHKEKKQAHVILGFLTTTIYDSDRYPLEVLNTVLSGQAGRLFVELRDKAGLAYSVTSFFQEGIDPGFMGVYIGTSPEKLDFALDSIKREFVRIKQERIASEELERAKRFMIGCFEVGLQTNSAKAATMALGERYGLGHSHYMEYPKRISEVIADDVLRVAEKYIDLDRYSLAVTRPPQII